MTKRSDVLQRVWNLPAHSWWTIDHFLVLRCQCWLRVRQSISWWFWLRSRVGAFLRRGELCYFQMSSKHIQSRSREGKSCVRPPAICQGTKKFRNVVKKRFRLFRFDWGTILEPLETFKGIWALARTSKRCTIQIEPRSFSQLKHGTSFITFFHIPHKYTYKVSNFNSCCCCCCKNLTKIAKQV